MRPAISYHGAFDADVDVHGRQRRQRARRSSRPAASPRQLRSSSRHRAAAIAAESRVVPAGRRQRVAAGSASSPRSHRKPLGRCEQRALERRNRSGRRHNEQWQFTTRRCCGRAERHGVAEAAANDAVSCRAHAPECRRWAKRRPPDKPHVAAAWSAIVVSGERDSTKMWLRGRAPGSARSRPAGTCKNSRLASRRAPSSRSAGRTAARTPPTSGSARYRPAPPSHFNRSRATPSPVLNKLP